MDFFKRSTLLVVALIFCSVFANAITMQSADFRKKIDLDEYLMWSRFFSPKTNLIYECLSSFDDKTCQNHLPSADEVKRQYPNPCGYATGMEDCAIVGGTVLAALVDKYTVTKDEKISEQASTILDGLDKLVQPDGFVARGLCLEDGKSFYSNSSIDQYTHCVHGMWKYFESPMCSQTDKRKIATALSRIADRLIKNVTKENDFCSLRSDGKPCALRISRFTCEKPHAAARLPMVYAAAWVATGNEKYLKLYRNIIEEAISVSEQIKVTRYTPIYSFLQMQISLELLRETETDKNLKNRISQLMQKISNIVAPMTPRVEKKFDKAKLDTLYGDWRNPPKWELRNGYNIPKLGESRDVWRVIRETGELPLIVSIAPDYKIPENVISFFEKSVDKIDATHCASCGIIFHFAAYWNIMARK